MFSLIQDLLGIESESPPRVITGDRQRANQEEKAETWINHWSVTMAMF